jgi:coenzyme F420-reducing hydrogenase alpha subunit
MSKNILLKKATRIEGNADIHIQIEDGRIHAAQFQVHDFRGFETFTLGRRVEFIPHLVSRVCGLCSASHQVASLKAIEDSLAIETPRSVQALRDIILLGEWISSHAFSYFFLTMPDLIGISGGVFELVDKQPEVTSAALALRRSGQEIVRLLAKRSAHPVSLGIGRFLIPPTPDDLREVRSIAVQVRDRAARIIEQTGQIKPKQKRISGPVDQKINFLTYDSFSGGEGFRVYNDSGKVIRQFSGNDFEDHISEMRAEWSFATFPYLTDFGFPAGMVLVGPLARTFQPGGILDDEELSNFELTHPLRERDSTDLGLIDNCRLLEIFWAAKRILGLLEDVSLTELETAVDCKASGKGIGVVEAPRGVLVHSYLINRGCMERMRLLVATQFNNAFINLLLKDLADSHFDGDRLSTEGENLIGHCIRIFDPCLSCATH